MSRLRIAFFSPLNPQKSGVSDYSEELLPYLADHADLELVTGDYALSNGSIASRFPVLSASAFLRNRDRFDGAIYQLANSYYHHGYMIPCMERMPGLSVFHDYHLHHLMLGLTLLQGDFPALRNALETMYGSGSRALAWRLLFGAQDPYGVSMAHPLLQMSRAVVTHSRCASDLILAERPDCPVSVIPMGMPEVPLVESRDALRRKHGFSPDEFVLASISTLSYSKRLEVALESFGRLKQRYPGLRFLVAGGGRLGTRAREVMDHYNLRDSVRITGWVDAATYLEFLVCADVVLDLRYPSGAETSASLLRALSAGRPAVVSAQGSFVELPDTFTVKIAVGNGETDALCSALARLIDDRSRLTHMSESALQYARTHLRLDSAAAAYVQGLRKAIAMPAPAPVRIASDIGPLARRAWSTAYKVFRLACLYRDYGLTDTWRRVRSEAGLRRPGLAGRMEVGT